MKRSPDRIAKPRVFQNGSKTPTLSFRVRGDLYDRLKATTEASGCSLSEACERRLIASFDAETLEATLRRVVREEIAAALTPRFVAREVSDAGMRRLADEWARSADGRVQALAGEHSHTVLSTDGRFVSRMAVLPSSAFADIADEEVWENAADGMNEFVDGRAIRQASLREMIAASEAQPTPRERNIARRKQRSRRETMPDDEPIAGMQ